MPFFIPTGKAVCWRVLVKAFDINFSVKLRVQEMGGAVEQDLEPTVRLACGEILVGGRKAANFERHILLDFDNSFSKLRSKIVVYQMLLGDAAIEAIQLAESKEVSEKESAAAAAVAVDETQKEETTSALGKTNTSKDEDETSSNCIRNSLFVSEKKAEGSNQDGEGEEDDEDDEGVDLATAVEDTVSAVKGGLSQMFSSFVAATKVIEGEVHRVVDIIEVRRFLCISFQKI